MNFWLNDSTATQMAPSDEYDFINAKVHGMRSRLYEAERLSSLLSCKTLPELLQALYPRRGAAFLNDTMIERILTEQYFHTLAQVCRHMTGASRRLLEAILLRRTLENSKVLIQFWHSTRQNEPLPGRAEEFILEDPKAKMPLMEDLMRSESLPELCDKLPLAEISAESSTSLEPAFQRYEQKSILFYVFIAIDAVYYNLLWQRMEELSSTDRPVAIRILGAELDMANIFAALRLRFNYHLSGEQARSLLSPHGNLLNAWKLGGMCRAEEAGDMIQLLPSAYREAFARSGGDLSDAELFFWDYLYRIANRMFYESIFSIGVVLGFYMLKKIELMNLTRAIQGYRYELLASEISEKWIPLSR